MKIINVFITLFSLVVLLTSCDSTKKTVTNDLTSTNDPVLFIVGNNKVYNSEFTRVYEKNLSLVTDPAQKDLDNYLDLYVNYKLKLEEAYALKMDTVPSYIKEFNKYKKQLIEPYLKDEDTERDLIAEAYDRMTQEVNASHILIKTSTTASPEDTLAAYNKLDVIRKRILADGGFEKEAKANSEDTSAKRNGGNLNYFTAFQMVYPFETAAYTTEVGKVSSIFRTKFGYHILKIHDRRASRGEVEVAHIMLTSDEKDKNQEKIYSIKTQLNNGADFANLAKQYSDDKGSAKKGGALSKFSSGKMVKSFDEAAFALQNPGDVSEPFKTRYGWHIVKLIKKHPVKSFEELKPWLQKKVIQGQRAKILGKSVVSRLLKEYTIVENKELINKEQTTELFTGESPILTINGKDFPAKEFYQFKDKQKRVTPEVAYDRFKDQKVKEYFIAELPSKNPELKHTLQEYEEGLLLFDLMKEKIWNKAEKDSLGLATFFNKNIDQYQWNERAKAIIVTCDKKSNALLVQSMLKNNATSEAIKTTLTDKGILDIKEGAYEKGNSVFPKNFKFVKGTSEILTQDDQFIVVKVSEFLPAQAKELNETKGKVISSYQDYLEKEWIKGLKKQYPVHVNSKSLELVKSKYN